MKPGGAADVLGAGCTPLFSTTSGCLGPLGMLETPWLIMGLWRVRTPSWPWATPKYLMVYVEEFFSRSGLFCSRGVLVPPPWDSRTLGGRPRRCIGAEPAGAECTLLFLWLPAAQRIKKWTTYAVCFSA